MKSKRSVPASFRFLCARIAAFGLLSLATGCPPHPPRPPVSVAQTAPLRLQGLDVQAQGRSRTLAQGEALRAQQDLAVRLQSTQALHLYVLLEHADARRELLYPHPGDPVGAMAPGAVRLPQAGDWFSVEKAEAGDRLCLIGSEIPTDQLTCAHEARKGPDRGEDTPPPPSTVKGGDPPGPPSSPPPDDKDSSRGRGRWVIQLPFASP